jgi:hypothetical protein
MDMGFLDDVKKAAQDAQQAVQRQVDNLQKPPAPPEPPPVDGPATTAPLEPPLMAGAPPEAPVAPAARSTDVATLYRSYKARGQRVAWAARIRNHQPVHRAFGGAHSLQPDLDQCRAPFRNLLVRVGLDRCS